MSHSTLTDQWKLFLFLQIKNEWKWASIFKISTDSVRKTDSICYMRSCNTHFIKVFLFLKTSIYFFACKSLKTVNKSIASKKAEGRFRGQATKPFLLLLML